MMHRLLPEPSAVLEMEPEELAPFVLRQLGQGGSGDLNHYNFTLGNDSELDQKLGGKYRTYLQRLSEAWSWLEHEGLVAAKPGDNGGWVFITRSGERMLAAEISAPTFKAQCFLH